MKRKLIEYAVFEKMNESSLSRAVNELAAAEEHLARVLDVDSLKLTSFNESNVVYEAQDGTYVKANYTVGKNTVNFDNLEQLVIDTDSERAEGRRLISDLLEAVLADDESKAEVLFDQFANHASTSRKRGVNEAAVRLYSGRGEHGQPKIEVRHGAKDPKKVKAAEKAHSKHPGSYQKGAAKRKANKTKNRLNKKKLDLVKSRARVLSGGNQYTGKRKRHMNEWAVLTENVFGYIDYVENGHLIKEAKVKTTNEGEVVAVTLPTQAARNEAKLLTLKWNNMMKTDVKVLREAARRLFDSSEFCTAVAAIKRFNNVSDNDKLEESIGALVSKFPAVLYLTQPELSKTIRHALDAIGVNNYDDQTCTFMAEGILRFAHDAYSDRVERITQLSGVTVSESDDKYEDFQQVASQFFPQLDESAAIETKVFEDLYTATLDVRKIALDCKNEQVRQEASEFIAELEGVLHGQAVPTLELAAEVAAWLEDIVETNLPGAESLMTVSNKAHQTWTGDHPQMAKNAKVPGHPGGYPDGYGDPAPQISQDSMAYTKANADDARHHSWSNKGGKDVYPSLSNPHVPAPFGDYTMKGERGVDKEMDSAGMFQSNDTWPALSNPYIPKAVTPKQKVAPDNAIEDK